MKHTMEKHNAATLTEDIISKLPKTDIHLHLDGSIRLQTMIELAKKDAVDLPSYTTDGLRDTVFKASYDNLEEYLKTFGYSCAVLQKPENLERVAFEIAEDNWNEGVRYIEVRFAPQLLMNKHQDFYAVLDSVNNGLKKARDKFNAEPNVISGDVPPFHYGIIVCAMRFFGPWSEYYQSFYNGFPHTDAKRIVQFGSEALADAAIKMKQDTGIPIVSFDIAGAENGFPAKWHANSFKKIREANIHATVHAGEAYDAESIHQALFDLHAERIGHGFHLFFPNKIKNPRIKDGERYTEQLADYASRRQIAFEVSLTSNFQTTPFIQSIADHPLKAMLNHHIPVAICTDNRTVGNTSVTKEIMLAIEHFQLDNGTVKNIVMNGFRHSFFHGSYAEKTAYANRCETYYDAVVSSS